MIKKDQESFYQSVGKALTKAREQKKMTISQVASKSGEQYGTVNSIENGRPFSFHQALWMQEILGMNLNILLKDAINENSINTDLKEESNGEESNIEETLGLSDFI